MVENEYACTMKGSVIMFRGKQYNYERLNLLPDLCTLFAVKTRETEEGALLLR